LGAEDFEALESFSGGGSDDEVQEYRFDHFSTRDAMAEEVEHDIDSPPVADGDVMLNKENEVDDAQESEEVADETVNEPTPKRRIRSQGKKTFIIPDAVPRIRRMNQHPPSVSSIVSRRSPSPLPQVPMSA
jgi:hypothetical protein